MANPASEQVLHRPVMTTPEALARVNEMISEARRMRLERWEREWPVGHAEREANRPRWGQEAAED